MLGCLICFGGGGEPQLGAYDAQKVVSRTVVSLVGVVFFKSVHLFNRRNSNTSGVLICYAGDFNLRFLGASGV